MNPTTIHEKLNADPLKSARTIILNSGDPEEKRKEILAYFHATYDIDEKLYETLKCDETYYLRADRLRHPLIFYFGHTATFFINKLTIARVIDKRINPGYESMFAVGVDEMSWDDLDERHYDWPTRRQVKEYRDQVRELVDGLIRKLPLTLPITWESPFWGIMMGIEHERIHLETSSVLIRQLPIDQVQQLPFWEICKEAGEPPANELLPVTGGRVKLGKAKDHALYGWDNEYGLHEAEVAAFKAARYLVSNREFLEFVDAGCYRDRQWWDEEGWNWREFKQAEYPLFWIKDGDGWRLRTMASEIEMPWNWPVEVNQLEAKAFCNWKAARTGLPIRACRPRTSGTGCGMSARSPTNPIGPRRRAISIWSIGARPVRSTGSGPATSSTCSAMSGSGPKPPSTPFTVSKFIPGTMTSPPRPLIPGTT